MGDYPLGAKYDPNAPYNETENAEVEVDVYVWMTIGKKITVKTSDYRIINEGVDEDGLYQCERDFSDTDFWSLIHDKISIPEGWKEFDCDYTLDNM